MIGGVDYVFNGDRMSLLCVRLIGPKTSDHHDLLATDFQQTCRIVPLLRGECAKFRAISCFITGIQTREHYKVLQRNPQ